MSKDVDFGGPISKYLNSMQRQIRSNMTKAKVNASKRTYKSIHTVIDTDVGHLRASPVLYKTETGTAPRSRGGVVSFYDILEWTQFKGIAPADEMDAKRLAGAITRNILAEGTKTYQQGGRDDIYTNVLDNEQKKSIFVEEVADVAADSVLNIIDEWLQ